MKSMIQCEQNKSHTAIKMAAILRISLYGLIISLFFFARVEADKPIVVQGTKFPNHFRLAIKWNQEVPYQVEQSGQEAIIVFDRETDFTDLGLSSLPPFVQSLKTENIDGSFVATLKIAETSELKYSWKNGNFIVDILNSPLKKEKESHLHTPPPPASPLKALVKRILPEPVRIDVEIHSDKSEYSLLFNWDKPVEIAAVPRGNSFILGFSESGRADLKKLQDSPLKAVRKIAYLRKATSDVLIIPIPKDHVPSLSKEGNTWKIQFNLKRRFQTDQSPSSSAVPLSFSENNLLSISLPERSDPITLEDPLTGFPLILFPGQESSIRPQDFIQFKIISSLGGIAVLQKTDDLTLTTQKNILTFSSSKALFISSQEERDLPQQKQSLPPLLDFQESQDMPKNSFQLAKHYLGEGLYDKASQYLSIAFSEFPRLARRPQGQALRALLDICRLRLSEASIHVYNSDLEADPDGKAIKALFYIAAGIHLEDAAQTLLQSLSFFDSLPPRLRNKMLLLAAEGAIQNHLDPKPFLDALAQDALTPQDQDWRTFYETKGLHLQDKAQEALRCFLKQARESKDSKIQTRAQLAALEINALNATSPEETILLKQYLEKLQKMDLGASENKRVAMELANILVKETHYSEAMHILRQAYNATFFIDSMNPLTDRMESIFAKNILENALNKPIDIISFYEEFRAFAPIDKRQILLNLKLVEAYISLDLLDKARYFLETMLTEPAYPEIHLTCLFLLAEVYNRNQQYKKVIDLLSIENPEHLPTDLQQKRFLLLFKAFLESGLYEKAQDLLIIAADNQDTLLQRLELAWRRKNWREAQEILKSIVMSQKEENLYDVDLIMNYVVTAFFNNDREELQKAREDFLEIMKGTHQENAFEVLTGQDMPAGEKSPLAEHLSHLERFETLVSRLYASKELSPKG